MLLELWDRATSTQPLLPLPWAVATALVCLAVTWSPWGYRLLRHLVTLLHEAGHAMIAVSVGRQLHGIRLHSDTSGLTLSRGKPTGLGMVATLLAGYPAPAFVGLIGAWLLGLGYAAGSLWALVMLCAVMLVFIRNFYGLMVVLTTGVGVTLLSWFAPTHIITVTAYLLVWSSLLVAPRAVVDLQRNRRRGRGNSSDADQLALLTKLPALFWVGIFWLLCVTSLIAGGWLLLA